MKRILIFTLLILVNNVTFGQKIPAYNADALMKRASANDTVYVINFWATWCIPCVKEIPVFDTVFTAYKGKPVKVLLVSFDFKESYPDKINTFIKKKKLQPEVVWFSETNANEFIPKIENSWSGSLPATLIIQPSKKFRWFTEGIVTRTQLSTIINKQLSQ